MKLVQLLAKELKEWPEHGGPVVAVVQDPDRMAYVRAHGDYDEFAFSQGEWIGVWHNQETARPLSQLATDHATAIVTRADWEAEKARIAGKVDGGWKRHRGGKCPVEAGVLVDIRCRDGKVLEGVQCGKSYTRTSSMFWEHSGDGAEVMAWRMHKPAEQPAPKPCEDPAPAVLVNPPDGPLEWRDRIRALDTQRAELEATYQRQIGEIYGEREGLVGKLAQEGFSLIGERPAALLTWQQYAKARMKINAIKEHRELTGSGLREAKEAVEAYQDSLD